MNVLIVDDERIAVQGMMRGINWEKCGVDGQIFAAFNARQALELLKEQEISLILCDIEMPGDNGIQLLRQVRAEWPKIECIFLTCHAEFAYAQEAVRLGCLDYILKPAPYTVIEDAIQKVIQKIHENQKKETLLQYGTQWLSQQHKNAEKVQEKKRTPEQLIQEVSGYVMEHLSSPELTVQSIAHQYYINEDYLSRLFKRIEGISLNKFIIQQRMNLAAQLLEDESLSASAVATQVGFQNYPYFTAVFKKYFGCTPTEFRLK